MIGGVLLWAAEVAQGLFALEVLSRHRSTRATQYSEFIGQPIPRIIREMVLGQVLNKRLSWEIDVCFRCSLEYMCLS